MASALSNVTRQNIFSKVSQENINVASARNVSNPTPNI